MIIVYDVKKNLVGILLTKCDQTTCAIVTISYFYKREL